MGAGAQEENVGIGHVGFEGQDLGGVGHRFTVHAEREIGVGAVAIGRHVFRVEADGAAQVAHRGVIALEFGMGHAPPVERHRALRHQLHGLAKILKGEIVLAERHAGVATVVVSGAVIGRKRDGPVEVLHRLVGMAQIHERVAAIVVDGGVLRRELDRLVEVVDRLLGLVQAPLGDAAIAIDARLDEIGDLRRGKRLVIGGDRLVVLPAHERRSPLAGAQQGHVLGHGGDGACLRRESPQAASQSSRAKRLMVTIKQPSPGASAPCLS